MTISLPLHIRTTIIAVISLHTTLNCSKLGKMTHKLQICVALEWLGSLAMTRFIEHIHIRQLYSSESDCPFGKISVAGFCSLDAFLSVNQHRVKSLTEL